MKRIEVIKDPYFDVQVLDKTQNPQTLIYAALHQDVSSDFVSHSREQFPDESECGRIAVKRLLSGGRGHYGCYSSDTEVLTTQGWIDWPSYHQLSVFNKNPGILAVDVLQGTCKFERPTKVQVFDFHPDDLLYQVESQYLNFAVTADHRMLVGRRKRMGIGFEPWEMLEAKQVDGLSVRYLLSSNLVDSDRYLPDDMPSEVDSVTAFKIAGFFFGDGLRTQNQEPRCVRFHIQRPRKIAYLLSLGLAADKMESDRYSIRHPELSAWVHRNFSNSKGKVIPPWIMRLPSRELSAFWDGLKNSDGTRATSKSWSYDSVEKASLDLIQATAHLNGWSANMTLNRSADADSRNRPCWRLCFSQHPTRTVEKRRSAIKAGWTSYSGRVYCASVSTGVLMVRRKNKVLICGNCLEHPQISFNVGFFPQLAVSHFTRHRLCSFDVQSLNLPQSIRPVRGDRR